MSVVLQGKGVCRYFGGIKAVKGVDFAVERGSITSLIGPNGAGKTTLFNVITGIFPATLGSVVFTSEAGSEHQLDGYRVDEITGQGIARTFQNIRLFEELTALENVKLGAHAPTERGSPLAAVLGVVSGVMKAAPWLRWVLVLGTFAGALAVHRELLSPFSDEIFGKALVTWLALVLIPLTAASALIGLLGLVEVLRAGMPQLLGTSQQEREIGDAALGYLKFVGLLEQADELASNLAYGDQRRLEIARALASQPQLLLLDEPAAGMNPQETDTLMELIGKIRDAGITVLLIEHDMKLVMEISDHVIVLDHGERIASGPPTEVSRDPAVIEAYLGAEA